MADDTSDSSVQLLQALTTVINEYTSPEAQALRMLILRRLALTGDVIPSRIPAPRNITEIGGYLNLLDAIGQPSLKADVVASILGVASPSIAASLPVEPPLFFVTRANQRPLRAQASIPLEVRIRSDFAAAFDTMRSTIADLGAALPLLSPPIVLPPLAGAPPVDLMPYIGRTLDIVPATALVDANLDPIAVARLSAEAAGSERVLALVLDTTAPNAGTVATVGWTAWQYDAATDTYVEATGPRQLAELYPILNAAGWYRLTPIDTNALDVPASWARLVNITGLVAGTTTYGDELRLLYRPEQIAASSLSTVQGFTWNGTAFVE
jgi:hypothetical protein